MKRQVILIVLILSVLLTACGGGDVSTTGRQIRESERYSKSEIADAMDVVEEHFKKHFDGCKLHTIVYDEEATARKTELAMEQYGENTIVLLTDFYVEDAGDGSLNPGQTYTDYEWTLVKTFFGWELKDGGYA